MGYVVKTIAGLAILLCAYGPSVTQGLNCFQCQDVEIDSSLFPRSKTNPSCATTTFYAGNITSKTCSDGQVCGYLKGTATVHILGGVIKADVNIRDCVPPGQGDGCYSTTHGGDILSNALKFIGAITNTELVGTMCYCSGRNCIAGGCGSGRFALGSLCVIWWQALAVVAGALVLLIGLIACCCCCCRQNPDRVYIRI